MASKMLTNLEGLTAEDFEDCDQRYKFFAKACTSMKSLQKFLKNEIVQLFGEQVFNELSLKSIRHHIARWCVVGIAAGGLKRIHLQLFYTEEQINRMYAKEGKDKLFSKSLENPFNLPLGMSQKFQPDFNPNGNYINELRAIDECLLRMTATATNGRWTKRRKLTHENETAGDDTAKNAAAGENDTAEKDTAENDTAENAGASDDADENDGDSVDADENFDIYNDDENVDSVEAVQKSQLAVEAVKKSVQKELTPHEEQNRSEESDGDETTDGDGDDVGDGEGEIHRHVAAMNLNTDGPKSNRPVRSLPVPTYPKGSRGTSSKRRLPKQRSHFFQVPNISL